MAIQLSELRPLIDRLLVQCRAPKLPATATDANFIELLKVLVDVAAPVADPADEINMLNEAGQSLGPVEMGAGRRRAVRRGRTQCTRKEIAEAKLAMRDALGNRAR